MPDNDALGTNLELVGKDDGRKPEKADLAITLPAGLLEHLTGDRRAWKNKYMGRGGRG